MSYSQLVVSFIYMLFGTLVAKSLNKQFMTLQPGQASALPKAGDDGH
jgi:hypothetical protein